MIWRAVPAVKSLVANGLTVGSLSIVALVFALTASIAVVVALAAFLVHAACIRPGYLIHHTRYLITDRRVLIQRDHEELHLDRSRIVDVIDTPAGGGLSDVFLVLVVFGTVVFAMFAGFFFWWPKFTGKMLDERLGKIQFWMLFLGFHGTFLIQHWLGVIGMPRRYPDYLPEDGFTWMNQVSTVASVLLAASTLPFLWNVIKTWRHAPRVEVDDPWGYGASLEWVTSCPPPRHNFTSLPRIRSERPAFDLHHPEVAAMDHVAALPVGASVGAAPSGQEDDR